MSGIVAVNGGSFKWVLTRVLRLDVRRSPVARANAASLVWIWITIKLFCAHVSSC